MTTHALAAGDHDLAMWAAQIAYTVASHDDVSQLDMIQAERAAGDHEDADQDLNDGVINRRDNDLPPINLPPPTAQIVEGPHTWRTG